MLIDVEDPLRNLILNGCFYTIAMLVVAAVVPWRTLGAVRLDRVARWLALPTLALAILYEAAMPSRYNIRVDLLLLAPAYGLIAVASLVRLFVARQRRARRDGGHAT